MTRIGTMGVVALTLGLCAGAWAADADVTVATEKGVPGGVVVTTVSGSARVTAIDAATRTVTMMREDGVPLTYKAGPEVRNFDQIKVGDTVKATAAEALVVSLRKKGEPAPAGDTAGMSLATEGKKPGVVVTDIVEMTAKVKALDVKAHTATLELPSGEMRIVKARPDVDLTKVAVGDEVVFRSTQAVAVRIEKP